MAESLFASLYSRIKGSQEDVATVSLQYNGVALMYNRFVWMKNSTEDTPFWFYFTDGNWKQSNELRSCFIWLLSHCT